MGKVFYFQPGHETYPTYYLPKVQQIICNAARWAARTDTVKQDELYLSPFTPRIPFEPYKQQKRPLRRTAQGTFLRCST